MPGIPVQSVKLAGRGEYNSNRKCGRVILRHFLSSAQALSLGATTPYVASDRQLDSFRRLVAALLPQELLQLLDQLIAAG
jgi:hypothetical protein